MIGSLKYVKQAIIGTLLGQLEIRPDIIAVNEAGDSSMIRDYCQVHGIEYLVLK